MKGNKIMDEYYNPVCDTETISIHDINASKHHKNETYLIGSNQFGEQCTIVFNSFELLQWLDIERMKEQSYKNYYESKQM